MNKCVLDLTIHLEAVSYGKGINPKRYPHAQVLTNASLNLQRSEENKAVEASCQWPRIKFSSIDIP